MGCILETTWQYIEIIVHLCLSRYNELTLNLLWTYALPKKKVVVPPDCISVSVVAAAEYKAAVVTVLLEQARTIAALCSELGTAGRYWA